MSKGCFEGTLLFEHAFWLQILGDHGRMLMSNLAPSERMLIGKAKEFIGVFDQLLDKSRECLSGRQLMELTASSFEAAQEIRCFKLDILRQHLCEKVQIGLPPTFLNHMVNEVEEYLKILECAYSSHSIPALHPVHHHTLWLIDAGGHASAIADNLDETEFGMREKGRNFAKTFQELFIKALEYKGYLRTGVKDFPALDRFNCQVEREIMKFQRYLEATRKLICENKALGAITPLIPDHMLREECYYLIRLAEVSNIASPDCDPTRPRIEMCGCE